MGRKLDRISREDAITPLLTSTLKELLLKEEKKNIRSRIVLNKTDKQPIFLTVCNFLKITIQPG